MGGLMAGLQTQRTADFSGNGKNIVVAYLLWWFLGMLGVHRFYLDRPKSGVIQILLLALGWLPFFIGWVVLGIWWMLDAYFVYQYVNEYNRIHGGAPLAVTMTTSKSVEGDLDYLERLHSLHEKGVLTDDEYQAKRKDVMG
jgi:TM2 domain-containing membrane protein YozV